MQTEECAPANAFERGGSLGGSNEADVDGGGMPPGMLIRSDSVEALFNNMVRFLDIMLKINDS